MATSDHRVKITIALPAELVQFADRQAADSGTNRSRVIADALAQCQRRERERLAAEGYCFYAQEAAEFASASADASAEAWDERQER